MSDTDAARIELYDIAKQKVDERFAELLMKMLPHDPDRNASKDDVAVLGADLRTEMADLGADLRTEMADLGANLHAEMADLRTELRTGLADLGANLHAETADLRTELRTGLAEVRTEVAALDAQLSDKIHETVSAQTRTLVLSLVGSVTALAIANTATLALVG